MLCAKLSPELEVVETHEVGLSLEVTLEQQAVLVKGCAREKGAESKQQVVQCVRESDTRAR